MSIQRERAVEDLLEQFPEPDRNTREFTGKQTHHSDADSIRRHHGVGRYNSEAFDRPVLMPNVLEYEWDARGGRIAGGTDLLSIGKPGSGKSTLGCHLCTRSIDDAPLPHSKVVWRASQTRSEWLPLHRWVTLCLPAGVPIDAKLVPRDPSQSEVRLDVDEHLPQIVREVVYYHDLEELNRELLAPGKIHVVYPDPMLRGCQRAYENSQEKAYDDPSNRGLFEPEDPSNHFWFGWVLDRVENGPHDWTTLILDEIGDIAPQDASKDQYGTYQKVELLRDCWVDARKKGLSIFAFGHSSKDIHAMIRRKMRWRVTMNGKANPTRDGQVVQFDAVPMKWDQTSRMDVGEALIWNEQTFEPISWPNYEAPVSHSLETRIGGVSV